MLISKTRCWNIILWMKNTGKYSREVPVLSKFFETTLKLLNLMITNQWIQDTRQWHTKLACIEYYFLETFYAKKYLMSTILINNKLVLMLMIIITSQGQFLKITRCIYPHYHHIMYNFIQNYSSHI